MRRDAVVAILAAVVAIMLYREFWPQPEPSPRVIDHIVTKYDTVTRVPKWIQDSLKKWPKQTHTTDTVNLYHTVLVVDTEYVSISPDTTQRPNIWPLIAYRGGSSFGDTARVTTFSLRSGALTYSTLFIPGILTGIDADSAGTPKLTFDPFPVPPKPSLLYRLKLAGIGFGACSVVNMVK